MTLSEYIKAAGVKDPARARVKPLADHWRDALTHLSNLQVPEEPELAKGGKALREWRGLVISMRAEGQQLLETLQDKFDVMPGESLLDVADLWDGHRGDEND